VAGSVLIDRCTVVDAVDGRRPARAVSVVDGRIAAIEPAGALAPAPGQAVVDLAGATLMPGLWDAHCHPGLTPEHMTDRFEPPTSRALSFYANALAGLRAGVTGLRVVGEAYFGDVAARDAIAAGRLPGPRIWACGPPLKSTAGHGHARAAGSAAAPGRAALPDPWGSVEVDGAEAMLGAVRRHVGAGVDGVKLFLSGGIAGEREHPGQVQFLEAEVRAAVAAAHAAGCPVAAHVGGPVSARLAIDAGVDAIEHAYTLDPESAGTMAERGIWYVPTLSITHNEQRMAAMGWPEAMIRTARALADGHRAAFDVARAEGVRIASGSDMRPVAEAAVEEVLVLAGAGLDNRAALAAATVDAAALAGMDAEVGTVAVGRAADLIAVDGDPIADIAALRRVTHVVRAGELIGVASGAASRD
jgi:imidazolonepropionase-like amidohydrolase